MTATTVECWTNLTNWFRNGEIGDPWELCPLTKAITRRTESPPCLPEALRKRLEAEAHEIESQFNIVEESGFLKISYTGPRRIPEQEDAEQMSIDKKKEDPPPFTRNFSIDVRFARFGQSMAIGEFGIGNPLQIAVSSPFETLESHSPYVGEVHVLSVSETDGIVPSSALHPSHSSFDIPGIRFGFSLASLKIHRKHGHISALAVGTPGWNPAGRVFLYTADGSSTLDIIPKLTIVPYDEAKIQFRSRYGKRALGTKLFVADIDGDGQDDLLIASPWSDFVPPQNETQMWDQQSGRIAVFTGPQLAEFMIGGTEILDEDCAYKISCPTGSGFERFGTSMAFAERAAVLLVGEPGFGRDSHIVGSGKVYGIKIIKGEPKTVFQIDGPEVEQGDLPTEFGGGGLTSGITKEGIEWIAIAAHNEVFPSKCGANVRTYKSFDRPEKCTFIPCPRLFLWLRTLLLTKWTGLLHYMLSNLNSSANLGLSLPQMAEIHYGSHQAQRMRKTDLYGHTMLANNSQRHVTTIGLSKIRFNTYFTLQKLITPQPKSLQRDSIKRLVLEIHY